MIDMRFFWGAIALMLIIIVREILRKRYNFDMDQVDVNKSSYKWFRFFKFNIKKKAVENKAKYEIIKNTGTNSLTIVDTGVNKETVRATLRQITDMDYESADYIVNHIPCTFMSKISVEEADLTKKALEFVGARVEIK